jgi:hypothetical protein
MNLFTQWREKNEEEGEALRNQFHDDKECCVDLEVFVLLPLVDSFSSIIILCESFIVSLERKAIKDLDFACLCSSYREREYDVDF